MNAQPSVMEPSVSTIVQTDEELETEDGPVAHIVKTKRNEDAAAKVLRIPVMPACHHRKWSRCRDCLRTFASGERSAVSALQTSNVRQSS